VKGLSSPNTVSNGDGDFDIDIADINTDSSAERNGIAYNISEEVC
jgi:hypothetical protein